MIVAHCVSGCRLRMNQKRKKKTVTTWNTEDWNMIRDRKL